MSYDNIEKEEEYEIPIEMEVLLDTIVHVSEVKENLEVMGSDLTKRGISHDRTKFQQPEFSIFSGTREEFKKANYGTPEYDAVHKRAQRAIDHHYENNRHHTGHFEEGVKSMNLLDLLEMLADWKAAARRSPDLSFEDSLPRAFERYGFDESLQNMVRNTIKYLGW